MCECAPIRKGYVARVTSDERGPVTLVWLTHPHACPVCAVAHVAMRVRNGRTLCSHCDTAQESRHV